MIASHQRAVWLLALLVCGVTNAALPNAAAAPAPKMVEAKGPDRKEFRTSVIKLACASPRRMSIGYFSRTGVGRDRGNAIDQICNRRARLLVRAKKLDNKDRFDRVTRLIRCSIRVRAFRVFFGAAAAR
jgi:hypothetical protein